MKTTIHLSTRWILCLIVLWGCSRSDNPGDALTNGWSALEAEDLEKAIDEFKHARRQDPRSARPYAGLGWAYGLMGDLTKSEENFRIGSAKARVESELWAGWGLALNALSQYGASNASIDSVLLTHPSWRHEVLPRFDYRDLRIVKAENYFVLGLFAQSLAEVRVVVPTFTADVQTEAGRAMLAERIELLRDYLF